MRSKLLSLHLLQTILKEQIALFYTYSPVLFSPLPSNRSDALFIHAVKQYLCLSLGRNAVSVVPQVFEISMEIFGRVVGGLRSVLKKELSVIFTEIIIPVIEARQSITFHQRITLLSSLNRIFMDSSSDGAKMLVEIYLNYDCDVEGGVKDNIWERLINALSKVMTTHYGNVPGNTLDGSTPPLSQTLSGMSSNNLSMSSGPSRSVHMPPAITTTSLTNFTKEQVKELYSSSGDYNELKKRGLEVLVRGILKGLVQWCEGRKGSDKMTSIEDSDSKSIDKGSRRSEDEGSLSLEREDESGSGISTSAGRRRLRAEDDPTQFETLKHRKQVMQEGIKRFNFKPKKVKNSFYILFLFHFISDTSHLFFLILSIIQLLILFYFYFFL